MPEAFPGAVISFPMLGEHFSINPSATYTLFGHTFYWYGVIIGIGFLLGALYCFRRGPRDFGVSTDTLTDVVLIGLPATLIGARIYYVAFHFDQYRADTLLQTLWNCCKIWEGGTAIPGGLLLMGICVWIYARVKKIPFGAIMDTAVFGLLIGQTIGRWSNFINREYIGEVTDIFCRMGLTTGGTTYYVHPLFLYESFWMLNGFILLHIWSKKGLRKYDGEATIYYVMWYSLIRMALEGIRTAPMMVPGTELRVSQLVMAGFFAAALSMYYKNMPVKHDPKDLYVNRVKAEADAPAAEAEPADNANE